MSLDLHQDSQLACSWYALPSMNLEDSDSALDCQKYTS
jgi:hypothetical protein